MIIITMIVTGVCAGVGGCGQARADAGRCRQECLFLLSCLRLCPCLSLSLCGDVHVSTRMLAQFPSGLQVFTRIHACVLTC